MKMKNHILYWKSNTVKMIDFCYDLYEINKVDNQSNMIDERGRFCMYQKLFLSKNKNYWNFN
jgi:hypothetical protein